MIPRVEISCGLDVHRKTIAATILKSDGRSSNRQFLTTVDQLIELKEWIKENNCQRVLMEATGIYWIPVYSLLEFTTEVHVVNPLFIKYVPGRKTDMQDSAWIAEISLNGLFKPSYIPPLDVREFRDLTRTHRRLIDERTSHKNRINKVLTRSGIRLASVISDIFGKSGLKILSGILEGKPIKQVMKGIKNKLITKKKELIEAAICGNLSDNDIFVIKQSLETIQHLNEQIKEYENRILQIVAVQKRNFEIVTSMPGIGATIGSAILAEIGDIKQFPGPKHLVSWAGLAPSVNESAGKSHPGHITKRGSKYLRTMVIEAGHSVARGGPSVLKDFFLHLSKKKGYKKAIVALARKILSILYHLLTNDEIYVNATGKSKKSRLPSFHLEKFDVNEIISVLSQAGYSIQRN
jgi:transposase